MSLFMDCRNTGDAYLESRVSSASLSDSNSATVECLHGMKGRKLKSRCLQKKHLLRISDEVAFIGEGTRALMNVVFEASP